MKISDYRYILDCDVTFPRTTLSTVFCSTSSQFKTYWRVFGVKTSSLPIPCAPGSGKSFFILVNQICNTTSLYLYILASYNDASSGFCKSLRRQFVVYQKLSFSWFAFDTMISVVHRSFLASRSTFYFFFFFHLFSFILTACRDLLMHVSCNASRIYKMALDCEKTFVTSFMGNTKPNCRYV